MTKAKTKPDPKDPDEAAPTRPSDTGSDLRLHLLHQMAASPDGLTEHQLTYHSVAVLGAHIEPHVLPALRALRTAGRAAITTIQSNGAAQLVWYSPGARRAADARADLSMTIRLQYAAARGLLQPGQPVPQPVAATED